MSRTGKVDLVLEMSHHPFLPTTRPLPQQVRDHKKFFEGTTKGTHRPKLLVTWYVGDGRAVSVSSNHTEL